MTKTTQEGNTDNSTKTISAAKTRILSAKGSINLPKLVTSFLLLAKYPSKLSVKDKIKNNTNATHGLIKSRDPELSIQAGQGDNNAATKTGTKHILIIVTILALVKRVLFETFPIYITSPTKSYNSVFVIFTLIQSPTFTLSGNSSI